MILLCVKIMCCCLKLVGNTTPDDDTKRPATEKPPKMAKNVTENQTYVVETITMTTITEHRIIRKTADGDGNAGDQPPPPPPKAVQLQAPAIPEMRNVYSSSVSVENMKNSLNATIIPKFNNINGTAQAITGILKGGKLRKTDGSGQVRKLLINFSNCCFSYLFLFSLFVN